MREKIQKFYDNLYVELKEYVLNNTNLNPYIFKEAPKEKLFPVIIIREIPREAQYTTLKYTDEKIEFNLEIDIYAIQTNNIAGMTICKELSNVVENFFNTVYRMKMRITPNAPNVDIDVNRTLINVNCVLDTKFKNNLVIYPI